MIWGPVVRFYCNVHGELGKSGKEGQDSAVTVFSTPIQRSGEARFSILLERL